MADTTRAQVIMRTRISDKITKTFEQDAILLDLFMQGKAQTNNTLGAGIAAYVSPNPSFGAMAEAAYFPVPGETEDVLMKVYSVDQAQTGKISGRLMDIPDDLMLEGALSLNTKRDTLTFKKKLSQFCYGDASGSLGVVATSGISGLNVTFGGARGSSQILKGARLQFYTAGGTQHAGTIGAAAVCTVLSNNLATGVVAFDQLPSNAADADIVVYEGSYGLGFHGLAYHVNDDTGTYQGVSRASYATLRATVLDAAGGSLTVAMIDKILKRMRVALGVNVPLDDIVMISHPDQELAYRTLGYALNRVVPLGQGTSKFDLSFGMASHMGLRWKLDNDCPRDRIYFLRMSSFQRFMNRNPGLLIDENGDSLHLKPGSGTYAWEYHYYMLCSGDIGCINPLANGCIKNLALVA